jgi:hypothetical protein
MKDKFLMIFKSRTFYTLAVMFIINGTGAIKGSIPAEYLQIVDLILSVLATYFHVNPSQDYKA